MSINNKIRAALSLTGHKPADLAECLGITVQAVRNKFSRDSFSAEDLIRISDYLQCDLALVIDKNQRVIFDITDVEKRP